ncbi:hypothetical protein DENSPDRAFT_874965 [Dentipellis sp. KUC8613]|nr:hypothetical protein DENSPDRAFT_874965 [Dentipellis sp. KUC8613]
MEFLSQTYVALRGPTGAPQSADDTIARLADRLSPATLLADRRAAVLALKGLARKHKALVGAQALAGLLDIVAADAELDPDIGRAALETVTTLCDALDSDRDVGLAHADRVLEDARTVHKLCVLLVTLLQDRLQRTQAYFLKAPGGPTAVVALLDETREIMSREAITLLATLIDKSTEIQKILAFEGIFEKLFGIVTREGGLDGGSFVGDVLAVVETLLRFNASNQSYFRETPLPALLCSLLYFNPAVQPGDPVPQEFALQFWNHEKTKNAAHVLGLMGILVGSKGTGLREGPAYVRLLLELALASNAPTRLKVQALRLLPASAAALLPDLVLTPYMPVPETNGEEWDRLEAATGIDALLELIMQGEYAGVDAERRGKEGMDLRAAAVGVFENFLRQDHVKEAIVAGMLPPADGGPAARSPMTPLLFGLVLPPRAPPDRAATTSFQLAAVLFAHLLRHDPACKALARRILPPPLAPASADPAQAGFFVPADGAAPGGQGEGKGGGEGEEEEEEEAQTLLQLLTEHLSLAFLSRGRAGLSGNEMREWDRVILAYLALLAQWLWEDPRAVREFVEAGGVGVLVEQLNQPSEEDVVVPGLCAFLLGVCYEFNREPGEITRASMHPLLTRLGADVLATRMARVRDDERLKAVAPDFWVLPCPTPQRLGEGTGYRPLYAGETELWFDWAFVEFWKSNMHTIQRGIVADPDSPPTAAAQSGEESMLVASLRAVIAKQTRELADLAAQLQAAAASTPPTPTPAPPPPAPAAAPAPVVDTSAEELAELRAALDAERTRRAEVEKEQEDLLVLLDEVSSKRARDKGRMREAGLEVSEDEDEDEEDEGEDGEE